jgi:hypothetical protein
MADASAAWLRPAAASRSAHCPRLFDVAVPTEEGGQILLKVQSAQVSKKLDNSRRRSTGGKLDAISKAHAKHAAPLMSACILSPDSNERRVWDLWMVALLGYVAITVPLRLGFDVPTEPREVGFWFEALVDANFVADIVLNFRTAFIDPDGFTVYDPRRIARHYGSGWFLVDLMSSLPLPYLQLAANKGSVESTEASSNLRAAKMLRLLRLAKMLRLARMAAILERYSENLEVGAAGRNRCAPKLWFTWCTQSACQLTRTSLRGACACHEID